MMNLKDLLFILLLFIFVEENIGQRCSSIPRANKVQFTCSRGNFKNSQCFFRCPVGYNLANQKSEVRICRCTRNRCRWNKPPATCIRGRSRITTTRTPPRTRRPNKPTRSSKCAALRAINGRRIQCTRQQLSGSACTISCRKGFRLANQAQRSIRKQCRCSGSRCQWTGPSTKCVRVKPKTIPKPPTTKRSRTARKPRTTRRPKTTKRPRTTRRPSTTRRPRQKKVRPTAQSTPRPSKTRNTFTTRPPLPPTTAATKRITTLRRIISLPEYSVENDCPVPDFGRHSFQVVETWPTGGIFRVVINKAHLRVEEGWSVVISFTRSLPADVKVMSWNSELVSAEGKYLSLSSAEHNEDLTGYDIFSFTLILLNTNIRAMAGYTALVGFYPQRVENASCFATANNANPGHYIQRPVFGGYNYGGKDRTEQKPTYVPPQRPTIQSQTPPARIPVTRPPRPRSTQSPPQRNTRPPLSRIPKPQTSRPTNPPAPQPNAPNYVGNVPTSDVKINRAAVRRHQGNCNILHTGLRIKNHGYEVVGKTNGRQRYRFNADVVISGQNNYIDDWTLKVVFSKRISSIEVWEARMERKSSDDHVYIFRPLSWNAQLREDFSFLIIPEMLSQPLPQVVMYLCPSGETPDFSWNGIFKSPSGQQQNSNNGDEDNINTIEEQERLRLRQEQIAREKALQEEERRRQQQLEQEKREREQNGRINNGIQSNNNNQNNNGNNNSNNNNNNNNNGNQNNNNGNQNNNNGNQNNNNGNQNNNNGNQNNNNNNRNNNNNPNNNNGNNNHERRPLPPGRPSVVRRPSTGGRCSGPRGRLASGSGQSVVNFQRSPPKERRPYDYNEVLAMSILFYEAQRSGKLPANNRIPWRGDSALRDGCDVGIDLTGGWYDAGDFVKFGFPMAWSVTTLAWGVIEFKDAYMDAGQYDNVRDSLKWVTDYFIKAHPSKYEFYGQVGNGQADHGYWGRPEEMTMNRPSYKIDSNNPGSEIAAETAAAMAACSIIFRDSDPQYANLLVRHAKELYEFADLYRQDYHKSISDVTAYYRSYSGYNDELVWGALWLYRATKNGRYLEDAKRKYREFGGGDTPKLFSWDDKRAGSQVLMAKFTGEEQYINHVAAYQRFLQGVAKTPRGLTWLDQWGSNRYAANGAFIALASATVPGMPNKRAYVNYARSQIHFMLGSGGRSYVVGYGKNPPAKPHHRSSSCRSPPSACSWGAEGFHSPADNPKILYGALIAGPSKDGNFVDNRGDYVSNEVATDYNAGFQGALAGLKHFKMKTRN